MKSVSHLLFAIVLLSLFFSTQNPLEIATAQDRRRVIVLSPGHGWLTDSGSIDPGAVEGDLVEKDVVLDVARHTRGYLSRCPIEVYLTREGDDPEHTLSDVADLVNDRRPSLGISIHANSSDGNPTGVESWHTVGGYDDTGSQRLATLLSAGIVERFSIPNRGIKPETSNRHGGLYIHDWEATSALVEIGFLQGDAELLRDRRPDFGRAIARSALDYLEMPVTCADAAVLKGVAISTYFPNETKNNEIRLLNDGLAPWRVDDYVLKNVRNPYGGEESYSLSSETPVGEIAVWEIPVTAPSKPGIYQQVWQLERADERVGSEITVYIIVFPEEAREMKEDIDRRIEELRTKGEEEIEEFIKELEKEIEEWIKREIGRQIPCGSSQVLVVGLVMGYLLWLRR